MSKSIVQVHIPGRHAVCSNVIPYTDIIVVFIGYTMDMLANIIYLLDATALAKPTCELTGSNDE